VTRWLFEYLTPETMAVAAAVRQEERRMLNQPSSTERRRQSLNEALARLEKDRQAGLYDGELATQRYRNQHRDLMGEMATLAPQPSPLSALTGLPELPDGSSLEDLWPNLPRDCQHAYMTALIERIEVDYRDLSKKRGRFDPDRVTIVPRFRASVRTEPEPELLPVS